MFTGAAGGSTAVTTVDLEGTQTQHSNWGVQGASGSQFVNSENTAEWGSTGVVNVDAVNGQFQY